MPKVSVIVPIYGVEKYIERCARSLFEQTLDDIEFLFIDDCTPDRSVKVLLSVLEEYPQRKEQVVIHRMRQNSGQAKVREWGMINAKGEYVIHCDSDDWVEPEMYRSMYEKALSENVDIVVCDYNICDEYTKTYTNAFYRTDKQGYIEDMASMKVSWSLWNKLVKRELLNVVYPTGAMGEDMAITMQFTIKAKNFAFMRESFYNYRVNPLSITQEVGDSAILNRFNQFEGNSIIVVDFIKTESNWHQYNNVSTVIKWNAKKFLWQSVRNKDIFRLWYNTFSNINIKLLFCPLIKPIDKVKYLLTLLRLYPGKANSQ